MKVTEKECKAFNELRMRIGLIPYKKVQMQEMIAKIIPCNDNYWPILVKLGIVEHKREGKKHFYMFTSSPVHIEKFNEYSRECSRTCKDKNPKLNIEEAIKLLKEAGYKIYKKIEKYEEI